MRILAGPTVAWWTNRTLNAEFVNRISAPVDLLKNAIYYLISERREYVYYGDNTHGAATVNSFFWTGFTPYNIYVVIYTDFRYVVENLLAGTEFLSKINYPLQR